MKKLLVLLCVIALLSAMCVPAMATNDRVAVVVQAPDGWSTPYLYAWGVEGEEAVWPGVPMVQVGDWFVAYMKGTNDSVIINDGSSAQTADLLIDPGMNVCIMAIDPEKVDIGYDMPIDVPAEDALPKPPKDIITAKVPDGWTSANLYAWADGGAKQNAAWPGVPMTMNDQGLWVGELTPGYTNIIVNDGGSIQTVDLTFAGGDAWVLVQDGEGKLNAPIAYSEPADWNNFVGEKPPVPESKDWYVAGDFQGWNCADEAYKMTDNGDGTFSYTLSLGAGSHQLKVTNGTWEVCFGQDGGPEGNYGFDLAAAGEVTVKYDGNGVVTVEGEGVGEFTGTVSTPDPVVGGTWYVAGTMNEWNCADDAYKMTDNGDGTYTYIFKVTPGDYQLKVTNGTWDTSFGDPNGPEGNYAFNVTDETNCVVKFDGAAITHEFKGDADLPVVDNGGDSGNTTGDNEEGKPATDVANPSKTAEKGDNSGSSAAMLIAIISTVVILAGGAVAVLLILKKKD